MSTVLAASSDRRVLAATAAELDQARDVVRQLEAGIVEHTLGVHSPITRGLVELPAELSEVVAQILTAVAAGSSVTIAAMPDELTTSTAAEQLGVSRPTLMKMIERGEIQAHRVGTHTRLLTTDVLAFVQARQARRQAAFDDLRDLEDHAGRADDQGRNPAGLAS